MIIKQKPVAFNVLTKPTGSLCNLNCTYCYYLEKQKIYPGTTDYRMKDQVLETFIKQYINTQEVPVVVFVWQGGEPSLCGLDFYKKIVALQHKHANGKKIENSFQTNGTLLNDEWCEFFKQNNFLVGISIDGPEEIHDHFRKNKSGNPSFKQVMNGINLLKKYKIEFNTLTVVNNNSSKYPLEIYRFLKEIGSEFIQFIPVVERKSRKQSDNLSLVDAKHTEADITEWSVGSDDYGDFLISVFNEWVRNDVAKHFVQLFDVTLANWVGEPAGLCVFSERCGEALVMEHNGDIYSCDHFVYKDYYLGNVLEKSLYSMLHTSQQLQFGSDKLNTLPNYCISCEYRFACHGECPKHRFAITPDGESGLNYLCKSYKKFFSHVHPYMQFMSDELAAKRSPANVMNWAKTIKYT